MKRNEAGTTTAEYAVVTGCATGFGAVLWQILTSDAGKSLLDTVINGIRGLLPF